MGVEEVDMAVPVGGLRRGDAPADAAPEPDRQLEQALAARRRPVFGRARRVRREREFDAALKRAAKRLASALAPAPGGGRAATEAARVRAYTEIVALATVLNRDRLRETARLLRWRRRAGVATLAACIAAVAGAAGAGWLPLY